VQTLERKGPRPWGSPVEEGAFSKTNGTDTPFFRGVPVLGGLGGEGRWGLGQKILAWKPEEKKLKDKQSSASDLKVLFALMGKPGRPQIKARKNH